MKKLNLQLYVLGDGEEEYRNMFLSYQEQYPDKVYVQLDYTDEMAKYIYAGCDAILMLHHALNHVDFVSLCPFVTEQFRS